MSRGAAGGLQAQQSPEDQPGRQYGQEGSDARPRQIAEFGRPAGLDHLDGRLRARYEASQPTRPAGRSLSERKLAASRRPCG
ncbi:hypothetical protein FAIPA1_170002 [Frankia sp. AiPs1]